MTHFKTALRPSTKPGPPSGKPIEVTTGPVASKGASSIAA